MEEKIKQILNGSFTEAKFSFHGNLSLHRASYSNRQIKFISKETAEEYINVYNNSKHNTLKDNTIVYPTQLSQLPSYKLKNFIEENKLSVKTGRKWEVINAVIIGDNFIRSSYKIEEALKEKYAIIETKKVAKYIPNYHNKITEPYILVNINNIEKEVKTNNPALYNILLECDTVEGTVLHQYYSGRKAIDQYSFFINLFNRIKTHNINVIFDSVLSEEINKGMDIDADMFSSMLNMIDSEDIDNINMVKEIMANSEYQTSEPYLSYLYNIHSKLRVANNNKNYEFLLKKLKKFNVIPKYSGRDFRCSIDVLLPGLIKLSPKYSTIYTECVRIHINHIVKYNLIKEIILN
jgi:hypothetical protein